MKFWTHTAIGIRNRNKFAEQKRRVAFCRSAYYNVLSYAHFTLVRKLHELSEAKRRAIWPSLNVSTWRRK